MTDFKTPKRPPSDVSGVKKTREDVDQWSTLLFLFTLSALPSYARQDESGCLVPRRDVARSDAPDAAALVVGALSVLHRLDANAAEGLRPDGSEPPEDKTSFARTLRPERCDVEESRTDFEPGFEREPVSDQDETEQKKVVGPFVSAYLGCLARHLRRFASRRGATAARGVGTAPSSIAGAFSAALETAKHAMESGAGTSTSAFGDGGGGAAAAESSACAEWLETACRLGTIPRRALYAHAPPYVLDNASTRWEE